MLGIFVLLLSTSQSSIAGIGSITEQTAAVPSIQRSRETLQGPKGTAVQMADAIQTQQGKAGITFLDNTRVQVNENSRLVIDEFVYDPKNKDAGKLALKMASGTVRYASGAIAQNNPARVNVNTPAATIAVRGTDFTATIDELGASTIILLPSCRRGWLDIERDCVTGIIDVITDVGSVTLSRPFEATRVENRSSMPLKPTTLNLTEDAINNMLIVSPPSEIARQQETQRKLSAGYNYLDVDFFQETGLNNQLDMDVTYNVFWNEQLTNEFMDTDFLVNLLDILSTNLLRSALDVPRNQLLPDWFPESGIKTRIEPQTVTLIREDGSSVQSVTVPRTQNTTIVQIQNDIAISNRVNVAGTTSIILNQK